MTHSTVHLFWIVLRLKRMNLIQFSLSFYSKCVTSHLPQQTVIMTSC